MVKALIKTASKSSLNMLVLKTDLEQGIPELFEWVRQQHAVDKVATATAEMETRSLVR